MVESVKHIIMPALAVGLFGSVLLMLVELLLRWRFVSVAFFLGPKVIKDEFDVRGEARIKVGKVFCTADHKCKFVRPDTCVFHPMLSAGRLLPSGSHSMAEWMAGVHQPWTHGVVQWTGNHVRAAARLPLGMTGMLGCFGAIILLSGVGFAVEKSAGFAVVVSLLMMALCFILPVFLIIPYEKKRARRTISQILDPTFW